MSEKVQKKRKRRLSENGSPSKKIALDAHPSRPIKVTFHDDGSSPVISVAPGLSNPANTFQAYGKPVASKFQTEAPKPQSHQLLLHSRQHPRLDYTASPVVPDQNLSHYLAAYDPSSNTVQVFPAYHLTLRSVLRREDEDVQATPRRTIAQQRMDLGSHFGSIRSKRALAGREANAIVKKEVEEGTKDDVAAAILDSVAENADTDAFKTEEAEAAFASRPIPKPNLAAETVEEVYKFDNLLPSATASMVAVKTWQENARNDVNMEFNHRVPANRVGRVGKGDDVSQLQALRYLHLLLEFHDALIPAGKMGKKVPKKDSLRSALPKWPQSLVDEVCRRFSDPRFELSKWHMDNLYTHMCALLLYVDGWASDITDLREDLRLENKQISQYFKELGCSIRRLTKTEQQRMGLNNAQAAVRRIASLKLPLDFPKPSTGRRK